MIDSLGMLLRFEAHFQRIILFLDDTKFR